ncbi:hypothetical protein ACFWV1_26435 [Streptomyces sp. NPDC058700]|uniref:hypothetical protein n=1 Tax=Streptomyces sp. NPDC058700 TaxID=3346607 RepID=UPI003668E243
MSEWGIALIAAGSAILGSIVTGFFAWKAGHRQAAAAEAAGQAQAAALISTVQATLDEQRRARITERRRQAYLEMLLAARECQISRSAENAAKALKASEELSLEGPEVVYQAALRYARAAIAAPSSDSTNRAEAARLAYLDATRRALNET